MNSIILVILNLKTFTRKFYSKTTLSHSDIQKRLITSQSNRKGCWELNALPYFNCQLLNVYIGLFYKAKSKQATFTRSKPTPLSRFNCWAETPLLIVNCSRNKKELMRASSIKMTLLVFLFSTYAVSGGGLLY